MYVNIQQTSTNYTSISDLSFDPEVDLSFATLPVNKFTVKVYTTDDILTGYTISLYDDLNNRWAGGYIITQAIRKEYDLVEVEASSPLALLDQWKMSATYYAGATASTILNDIVTTTPASGVYSYVNITMDSRLADIRLTGICPEQTARERLHWLCMIIGGLAKQCFNDHVEIIASPDYVRNELSTHTSGVRIDLSKTFWKPDIQRLPLIRRLEITTYDSFTDTEPASGEWETTDVEGTKWYFKAYSDLYDSDIDPTLPGSDASISGITLLNNERLNTIEGRMQDVFFRTDQISASVINNFQYYPGQLVEIYTAPERMFRGIIRSCSFTFGLQARADLIIEVLEEIQLAKVKFVFQYQWTDGDEPRSITIGSETYYYPENETTVTNFTDIYVDVVGKLVRFAPDTAYDRDAYTGENEVYINYTPDEPLGT